MRPRKACLLILLLALAQLLAAAGAGEPGEGERPACQPGLAGPGWVRPGDRWVPRGARGGLAPGADLLELKGNSGGQGGFGDPRAEVGASQQAPCHRGSDAERVQSVSLQQAPSPRFYSDFLRSRLTACSWQGEHGYWLKFPSEHSQGV